MLLSWFQKTPTVVFCLFAAGLPAVLAAQTSANRPAYQNLRQNENWSVLGERTASHGEDWTDPIKYVPVNDSGSLWLSFGGHLRVRGESWDDFDFNDQPSHSDTFGLGRALLHMDAHAGKHFRFFVEGKAATATDRNLPGGRRASDVDEGDLLNAFVDVSASVNDATSLTFRAGRQELLFGKERVVGPSAWGNSFRTFDGFTGIVKIRSWNVTGFWTRPVAISKFSFNRRDANSEFFGVYAAGAVPGTKAGLDVYWLDLDRHSASFNGVSGRERRHTVGSRVWGVVPNSGADYELEANYQFGNLAQSDISAWSAMTQVGYLFDKLPATPRFYTELNYASGDNGVEGKAGTFNQLFPTAHGFLGFVDTAARQNILDVAGGVTLKPVNTLSVDLSSHNFWRASEHDALYNDAGAVVRAGSTGSSKRVGSELDLLFKYKWGRHTDFGFGYSRLFAGQFIRETGPAHDIDFTYFWTQYTF